MVVLNHCSLYSRSSLSALEYTMQMWILPMMVVEKQKHPEGRLVENVKGNCFSKWNVKAHCFLK